MRGSCLWMGVASTSKFHGLHAWQSPAKPRSALMAAGLFSH